MLNVSQYWLDNINKQLRPEMDIKLKFRKNNVQYSITKSRITSFSYVQDGDILNNKLPIKQINVSFAIAGGEYDFGLHSDVEAYFVLKQPNLDEEVWFGKFQVNEKNIPQNGLIATYSLNNMLTTNVVDATIIPFLYGTIFKFGSNKDYQGNDTTAFTLVKYAMGWTTRTSSFSNLPTTVIGKTLGVISRAEVFQNVASACGMTFNVSSSHGDPTFTTYNKTSYGVTYEVNPDNCYSYPEFIKNELTKKMDISKYSNAKGGTTGGDITVTFPANATVMFINVDPTKYHSFMGFLPTPTRGGTYTVTFYGSYIRVERTEAYASDYDITLRMYVLNTTNDVQESTISSTDGSEVDIDNKLINANYYPSAYNYYSNWINETNYIECDFRIDPRLELFDKVKIIDKSGNIHYAIAEHIEINFNGGFKGKVKARKFTV